MLSQSCPFITNDLFMRVITSFPARMLISFIPPHIRTLFHNVQAMAGNLPVMIQLKCIRWKSWDSEIFQIWTLMMAIWKLHAMAGLEIKQWDLWYVGDDIMESPYWAKIPISSLWLAEFRVIPIPDVIVSHRPIVLCQGHSTWSQEYQFLHLM